MTVWQVDAKVALEVVAPSAVEAERLGLDAVTQVAAGLRELGIGDAEARVGVWVWVPSAAAVRLFEAEEGRVVVAADGDPTSLRAGGLVVAALTFLAANTQLLADPVLQERLQVFMDQLRAEDTVAASVSTEWIVASALGSAALGEWTP